MMTDDKAKRPAVYDKSAFHAALDPTRIGKDAPAIKAAPRVLTNSIIDSYSSKIDKEIKASALTDIIERTDTIRTSPIFITTQMKENKIDETPNKHPAESPMFSAIKHLSVNRIIIDNTTGSTTHWILEASRPPLMWETHIIFLEKDHSNLFKALYPSEPFDVLHLEESPYSATIERANIIDIFFIPYSRLGNIMHWVHGIFENLEVHFKSSGELLELNLWIPSKFIEPKIQAEILAIIRKRLQEDWEYRCTHYNAAEFGDCVCAMRCYIQIIKVCERGRGRCNPFTTDSDPWIPIGYGQHITPILNDSLHDFTIRLPSEFDVNAESIRSSLEWYHPSTISVISKDLNEYAARPAYMNILDPTAPCSEPDRSQGDGIFGKRFGIPFQDEETRLWFAQAASTSELLAAYSIPESMLSFPSIVVDTINNIDQLLAGGMPYRIRHASLNPDQQSDSIEDNFVEGEGEQVFAVQCYHTSNTPEDQVLDWSAAYQKDPDTQALITILAQHKAHEIPSAAISTAPGEYKSMLAKGLITIVNNKLVYFKTNPDEYEIRYPSHRSRELAETHF